MKRFWMLALLMAGMLALPLGSAAFAKSSESMDNSSDDSSMEDVNSALGTMSAHMNDIDKTLGLKFFGDVRLRYAFICQGASQAGSTIADSSRGRYRARFGATKKLGDFTANFRIATGSTAGIFSQNNTFDTAMSNPGILIDTANIRWEPSFANGLFSITAGKMSNPLTRTAITFDPDIQPEGVALEVKKNDLTFRATYFELQNLYASGTTFGNVDLFMDNLQLEYNYKFDTDTVLGLLAGYEYIPNAAWLVVSGVNTTLGKNPITAFGGLADPFGAYRDWNNVEGMISFKHKLGDVPMKWYVHVTDNLNGVNLPQAGNVYSPTFTNQYAWLAGVDIGATHGPGDFAGTIYIASLDPNATLPVLTDDDPGETNRQYIFGSLTLQVDNGVQMKLSEWAVNHEYYAVPGIGGPTALGGSSSNPELVSYLDCILSM
jgi:hypothetical protein